MNWDWDILREKAQQLFQKAGMLLLFQSLIGYLVACVSAGHPVTVNQYVNFLNHMMNNWVR